MHIHMNIMYIWIEGYEQGQFTRCSSFCFEGLTKVWSRASHWTDRNSPGFCHTYFFCFHYCILIFRGLNVHSYFKKHP